MYSGHEEAVNTTQDQAEAEEEDTAAATEETQETEARGEKEKGSGGAGGGGGGAGGAVEPILRSSLLFACIYGRCGDISATVRAQALKILGDITTEQRDGVRALLRKIFSPDKPGQTGD